MKTLERQSAFLGIPEGRAQLLGLEPGIKIFEAKKVPNWTISILLFYL